MGADIHTMAEARYDRRDGTFSDWYAIDNPVFPHYWYDENQPITGYNHPYRTEPISTRDYRLFSVLADVRNSGNLKVIKPPVGVPEDASPEWKKYVEEWGVDLHSLTVYTVQELIDAENAGLLSQTVHETGIVKAEAYEAFMSTGVKPSSWTISGYGSNFSTGTALEYEQQQAEIRRGVEVPQNRKITSVEMSWDWDLSLTFFRQKTLPALMVQGNPADVRVQMGFDN